MAQVTLNRSQIQRFLSGDSEPVAQRMFAYGKRVEGRAKRRAPVDTGRLRSSITSQLVSDADGQPSALVGTNVEYATYVHNGTGIYGPTGSRITPTSSRFLVFQSRQGRTVFARSVRGMKGTPFLTRALNEVFR